MHTLAAYGDESDDEPSPRRRYSNEGINPLRGKCAQSAYDWSLPLSRQHQLAVAQQKGLRLPLCLALLADEEMPDADDTRDDDDGNSQDFREPAPPRGHPDSEDSDSPVMINAGMSKVNSTASLSGFERDTFEREDARLDDATTGCDEQSRDASEAEPAPPIRQSMEDDDEEEIDRVLEDSKDLLKMGPGSEGGSTPQYDSSPKEFEGPATPRAVEEKKELIVVPPAPDAPVDAAVEARFKAMFEQKARGGNYNQFIQRNKDFKNPSIYELFIEQYGIKEFGSNFPLEQYDPDGFTPECYYDYISKRQNESILKANAAAAKKAGGDAPAAKKPKV